MKIILFSVILIGLTFCAIAQISTNLPARLKTKVVCSGSGVSGTSVAMAPDSTYPGNGGEDNVTSPGIEHELKWTFVGRNGNKDVWNFTFTRMTKAGSSDKTTTSKEVQFDGKQTIVFEDGLHTVVMESPSAEDLKPVKANNN
jgi:hypothetical protein